MPSWVMNGCHHAGIDLCNACIGIDYVCIRFIFEASRKACDKIRVIHAFQIRLLRHL